MVPFSLPTNSPIKISANRRDAPKKNDRFLNYGGSRPSTIIRRRRRYRRTFLELVKSAARRLY